MHKARPYLAAISAIAVIAGTSTTTAGKAAAKGAIHAASWASAATWSAPATISQAPRDEGTGGAPPAKVSATLSAESATGTAGCPRSIWRDNDTPAVASATSTGAIDLGVRFRADRDGYVTGIRFYKGAGNTGQHIGQLWSWNGEKLAQATFTGETSTGWQQVSFSSPVRVSAGAMYVAAYYAPAGHYSYTYDYFASAGRVRPPLTALKNGENGGNGVYRNGAGFPTSSYRSTNYWVDPIFDPVSSEICPATIWTDSQVPGTPGAGGASPVELGVKFRAGQDGFIQGVRFFKGPGNTGTHVGRLWTASGQKLGQATFVAESPTGWQEAWFPQPVPVTAGTTYVASYFAPNGHYTWGQYGLTSGVTRGPLTALADGADGGNGVYAYGSGGFPTSSYHASNYGVDVLFTAASGLGCPCSLWPSTAEPSRQSSTDTRAAELGVRFTPLRSGYIKGIRFYKGSGNTGSHIGRLWSDSGTRLAQATFSGETASGWQQVLFSSPVAVTAGTKYVASYYAPAGHYANDPSYFAVENTTRGPLTALTSTASTPNGVYRYGSGFPSSTYQATNYWVDVVYDSASADTTPPVVVSQSPSPDAMSASVGSVITAGFSEPVTGSSITVSAADGSAVSGTTSYDSTTRTAQFTPSAPLPYLTRYTVRVSGARDSAGNVMTPVTWTFTTAFNPDDGPGGPVGVITSSASPYSSYYAEILRAEGLNEFSILPLNTLTAAELDKLAVAILGNVPLSASQVAMLTAWVDSGGRLIAMRPDPALAPLLGLSPAGGALTDGYLAVDNAAPAGAGITAATMQFHGTADRYTLAGASIVARLYSTATASTASPAVSVRDVGTAGGKVAAFSYDLARSVALTRQGNPAWAGQERDGRSPIRSDDMFYGGTSSPDWVNLAKVAIPQADEQQRLLVNLIETFSLDREPLPRFWYLPWGLKAVVVATGDDESPGTSGTSGRFDRYLANSPAGCSTADWQCLRFTSYVWPSVGLTDAQARAYNDQGFEIGLHPTNGCANFDPASLEKVYADQLAEWGQKYHSLPAPQTARFHCISFSDWDSQPKTELRHGIRLDTNYYYWPGSWVQDRPGFMTGSGMPMRFTDTAGHIIDVYQGATVMTDESQQSYPYTPNALLDRALGSDGYYGVFVANVHDSNMPTSYEDDQLVASAQNHHVPVVTARDVLHWFDGRGASSFEGLSWSGNALTFTVNARPEARGLRAALPATGVGGTTLSALTRDGTTVSTERITITGIDYVMFPAEPGSYVATYAPGVAGVSAATATPTAAGTATVHWTGNRPGTAEVAYGTSPSALRTTTVAEETRTHTVRLRGLAPGTTYYYRVTSTDARGERRSWPTATTVASFTTPPRDTQAPVISGLRVTPLPDSTVRVTWQTSEPAGSRVDFGTGPDQLDLQGRDDAMVTSHIVVLANLDASRRYYLRVSSADAAGNTASFPAPAAAATSFLTSPPGVADQTLVGFRTGTESGSLVVRGSGLAELTLSALTGPAGTRATGSFDSRILDSFQNPPWRNAAWDADVPAGARLLVSVRSGTTATPGPGWSAWTAVSGPGGRLSIPAGRYLQYRVEMTAGQAAAPVLHWIGFTYQGSLPGGNSRAQQIAG